MSLNRRRFLASAAALAATPATPLFAQTQKPISAVATFSVLGDMVARIGGDRVALTTLVGPNGDAHVYQPTPDDARAVASASVLISNGLAFEGWLERLEEASEFSGGHVVATKGVEAIAFDGDDHGDHDDDKHHEGEEHAGEEHADHDDGDHHEGEHHEGEHHAEVHEGHDHGAFDPHAWHDLSNGVIYVRNIAEGLAIADPDGADDYTAAANAYIAEMQALDEEIRKMVGAIPEDRRTIVTPHDAFGYFGHAYGVEFLAPQGFSTESEASAADVARLITQIKEQGVSAIFVENVSDKRLIEQIARETNAGIGGALFSDALSGPDGPAGTYLDMMRHNARTIAGALAA